MGKIGSFAGVTFEVSSNKILTFEQFARSGDARWSNHEINLKKPMPEFMGPNLETLSLSIRLNAHQGVNIESEIAKLRTFRDQGKVGTFVLGTKPITSNYWYIESLSESYRNIDGKGRIISAEVNLTIKEYPKPEVIKKVSIPKPKPKPKPKPTAPPKPSHLGTITIKVGMLNCRVTPSLKGRIVKVLRKGQSHKVYGTSKTDITWYKLGNGQYCSAGTKYVSFKKA